MLETEGIDRVSRRIRMLLYLTLDFFHRLRDRPPLYRSITTVSMTR
jgi:hypothetical protein